MLTSRTQAEEKIDALEARLAKRPESMLFLPLAEAYREAGRPGEAERTLRRGLRVHPEHHSARAALGRVLVDLDRPDEARVELTQVLEAAPDNLLAARLLADLGPERDRSPEGDEIVEGDDLSSLTLAELYARQGDAEAARSVYREVEARDPENPQLGPWRDRWLERPPGTPADGTPRVPTRDWKRPPDARVVALRRFLDAARRLRAMS